MNIFVNWKLIKKNYLKIEKNYWGKKGITKSASEVCRLWLWQRWLRECFESIPNFLPIKYFFKFNFKIPCFQLPQNVLRTDEMTRVVSTSTDINGLRLGPSYLLIKRGDLFLFFSFLLLLSKQTWDNGKEHLREVLKQLCDNVFVWLTQIVNHTMSWSKIFIPGWICHGEQSACHVAYYRRR